MAVKFEPFLERFPFPWPDPGDPIGPWLRQALLDDIIDAQDAVRLTKVQVELRKEALALERQRLDLHERALDAIGEALQTKG